MLVPKTPIEYARHAVDLHTRGIICPGEVWNQFADHVTAETFPQCMALLTTELQVYFRHVVLDDLSEDRIRDAAESPALSWLADYYAQT